MTSMPVRCDGCHWGYVTGDVNLNLTGFLEERLFVMLKHVMVTLDGSALSEKALEYARQIAADDARITLLSVLDLPGSQTYALYDVPIAIPQFDEDAYINRAQNNTREYLNKIADELRRNRFKVQTLIEIGDPATIIVDKALELDVDALVISTHGRSGIGRWLFGSVTQKVLADMPCPVLVVPGRKAEPETDETTAAPEHAD